MPLFSWLSYLFFGSLIEKTANPPGGLSLLYQDFKDLTNEIIHRSGFKTSDQVQGQGVRTIGKAQHTWVCEHLPEACNAAIGP
jgi:hypothetical protein